MESRIRSLFVLALSSVFTCSAHAADRVLEWKDVVAQATDSNPSLKASTLSYNAAESRTRAAAWNFGPRLVGELSMSRSTRGEIENNDSASATVGLRQNIFDLGVIGSFASAEADERSQEIALRSMKSELSRSLKNAYAQALFAQENERLSSSIIERRKQNLDLVQLRYEGGRENLGAVQLSRANFESAKFDNMRAKNDITSSKTLLRSLMAFNEQDSFTLSGPPSLNAPAPTIDLSALVQNAPEKRAADADEKRSRASVTIARGSLFPTAGLTASAGNYGDRFWPTARGWSVGVNLTVPIFDVSSYSSIQSAKATADASAYRAKAVELDLRNRIQNAHFTYLESVQALVVAELQLKAARTRADVARKRYESGMIQFDEWDRIETDLISRETAILQANLSRVEAESAFEFLIGTGAIP